MLSSGAREVLSKAGHKNSLFKAGRADSFLQILSLLLCQFHLSYAVRKEKSKGLSSMVMDAREQLRLDQSSI